MSHIDELFKKQKYAKGCSSKYVKKSNFISSDFVILLVCYLGRGFLHKNPRNICVAICFGFTPKIASLPRLSRSYWNVFMGRRHENGGELSEGFFLV